MHGGRPQAHRSGKQLQVGDGGASSGVRGSRPSRLTSAPRLLQNLGTDVGQRSLLPEPRRLPDHSATTGEDARKVLAHRPGGQREGGGHVQRRPSDPPGRSRDQQEPAGTQGLFLSCPLFIHLLPVSSCLHHLFILLHLLLHKSLLH